MRADIRAALAAAGYPTPTEFNSGNLYIDSYNLPVPGGSRTATLLLRYNFATSLNSSSWLQVALVDSTQYNSSTGVITGGIPYRNLGSLASGSSVNTEDVEFVSYQSDSADNNRFNFVILGGCGLLWRSQLADWCMVSGHYRGKFNRSRASHNGGFDFWYYLKFFPV